jgi:carboxymethylenebutenolidase
MGRSEVTIETHDGRCPASLFVPDAGQAPWPAVIVYMDGLGPRPAMLRVPAELAAHGYVALLPDLFYRTGPYEPPGFDLFQDSARRQRWFDTHVAGASIANVVRDTESFIDWLAARPEVVPGPLGVVGYCMGGARALAVAGSFPERIGAAASYHGSGLATDAADSPHRLAPRMLARVYVAGASEDRSFPDAMKERLIAAFRSAGTAAIVETYPARHGWVLADSPVHDEAATARHWATLLALLEGSLGARS